MTENSSSPSESPKNENSVKALILKGIIGAISLAGATGIPLLVQKHLGPSAPTASPTPLVPAQVAPAQGVPLQVQSSDSSSQGFAAQEQEQESSGKKKKKKNRDD